VIALWSGPPKPRLPSKRSRFSFAAACGAGGEEARDAGQNRITLADVKGTQARFLSGMSAEIKGYQIETCFGAGGCPNRAVVSDRLIARG